MFKNCCFSVVFILVSTTSLWCDEPDPSTEARLVQLRDHTRALFTTSAQRAPEAFKIVINQLANRANRLSSPLPVIDMSRVRVSYGTYDRKIWLVRETAMDLQAAAIAWSVPESPSHWSQELLADAEKTFDWVISHFTDEGTTGAPDSNIDRFIYVPLWESFILFGPDLPADQRARLAAFFTTAAQYQQRVYPESPEKASQPGGLHTGGYPNMDASYLLIQTEAASLTGEREFSDESKKWIALLGQSIHGSTWDYVKNWNAAPGYTQIVLDCIGRYYQLTHDPEALRQIGLNADYYAHYIEPSGLMDFGMTPFIKHDWGGQYADPYSACFTGLELVNAVAGTPQTAYLVQQERAALASQSEVRNAQSLPYWLGPTNGAVAPPASFVRAAPEIDGWQARSTTGNGTITFYATGRIIAADTRVSAMATPAQGSGLKPTALAGVIVEAVTEGTSYYIGDMTPQVEVAVPAGGDPTLKISERRHALGAEGAGPLPLGGANGTVRYWKSDPWKGGIPGGLPITVTQSWTTHNGRLEGDISVKATADCTLDEVRLSVVPTQAATEATSPTPKEILARVEGLCLHLTSVDGAWNPRLHANTSSGNNDTTLVLTDENGTPHNWKAGDNMSAHVEVWLAPHFGSQPP
jgi:hypothetical protein